MGTRGVFLDRDGTINVEVNFLRSPGELMLIPGAARAIRRLNDAGFPVCMISNQSGIARGFLTEEDLGPIHEKLREELSREGAHLDALYYCPHHPTAGIPPYNIACECRKPKTGMLHQGAKEFGLSLASCHVVGDRIVDVQVGHAVGAATSLVLTGYGRTSVEECREAGVAPDVVVPSIVEAVDRILDNVHQGKDV